MKRSKSELSPPESLINWQEHPGNEFRFSAPISVFPPGSTVEFEVERIHRSWIYKATDPAFAFHPKFRLLDSYGDFDVIASRPGYIGSAGTVYYSPTRYLLIRVTRPNNGTKEGDTFAAEIIAESVPGGSYRVTLNHYRIEANRLWKAAVEAKRVASA